MRSELYVKAKKYFEMDPDRLREAKIDDYCIVRIDYSKKTAEYTWLSADMNPGNGVSEWDDFEGAAQLVEEVLRTGEYWNLTDETDEEQEGITC